MLARGALAVDRGQVGVGLAVESSQRVLFGAFAAEGCLDPVLAGALDDADVCRGLPVHGAGARSGRGGVLFRRLPQLLLSAASGFAVSCFVCSRSGQAARELAQLPGDLGPGEPAAQGGMRNPVLDS